MRLRHVISYFNKEALSDNNMDDMFMEVYCEGLSPQEMNAVKGGTASPLCTCDNGGTYDCGCFSNCVCNGSTLICSCNKTSVIKCNSLGQFV